MFKRVAASILFVLVLSDALTVFCDEIRGVSMQFVPIGYAGNVMDSNGRGAVGYDYRIGQHEVTIAQFAAARAQDATISNGNEDYWAGLGTDAPAVRVTYHEAARFCNFLTSGDSSLGAYTISGGEVVGIDRSGAVSAYGQVFVLPTEDEWYKAAYFNGSSYTLYANLNNTPPVNGSDSNYDSLSAWLVSDGTEEQNLTYNMMGNVWEHSETLVAGQVLYRGAGYENVVDGLTAMQSTYSTTDSASADNYANVGFRVAVVPEPGTISLMGFSTIGLFTSRSMRRRRRLGSSILPVGSEHLCDQFDGEDHVVETAAVEAGDEIEAWMRMAKIRCVAVGHAGYAVWKNLDNSFWDMMVARQERKVAKRTASKTAFKRKALGTFDAFLERIMK